MDEDDEEEDEVEDKDVGRGGIMDQDVPLSNQTSMVSLSRRYVTPLSRY